MVKKGGAQLCSAFLLELFIEIQRCFQVYRIESISPSQNDEYSSPYHPSNVGNTFLLLID